MRYLDLDIWPRRQHFELFKSFDHPHFSMVANMDITGLKAAINGRGVPITYAVVYLIARAANAVPEFRYRLRPDGVVVHEVVHPSFTVLVDEELFSFCTVRYDRDFSTFADRAAGRVKQVKAQLTLENDSDQDDLLYMSAIPWVSFTMFTHPMHLNPADSVPRFAWGKFFEQEGRLKMPLGVQVHHALMDGLHVGRYYAAFENDLARPETWLG